MKESTASAILRRLDRRFQALMLPARRVACLATGHRRSAASIHSVRNTWYSWCDRCQAKLVRVGPGMWHAIPAEESRPPFATSEERDHVPAIPFLPSEQTAKTQAEVARRGYSAGYLARKHGISRQQAEQLIERIGADRAKLNAAAAELAGLV